jgi:hypothetical protein
MSDEAMCEVDVGLESWRSSTGFSKSATGSRAWPILSFGLVPVLVFLLTSASLLGAEANEEYRTLFYEDFDTENPQVVWNLLREATATVRDGCACLSLSE